MNFEQVLWNKVFCRMFDLVVIEVMTPSGHLSNINEIELFLWFAMRIIIFCENVPEPNYVFIKNFPQFYSTYFFFTAICKFGLFSLNQTMHSIEKMSTQKMTCCAKVTMWTQRTNFGGWEQNNQSDLNVKEQANYLAYVFDTWIRQQ